MNIAKRLDEAMRAAKIPSQAELARMSTVPQPTINRILKNVGTKGPEASTITKLAAACGVTFEWLHEGIEPMYRTTAARVAQADNTGPSARNDSARVSNDESLETALRLLMLFHGTDADGRARIMKVAEKVPRVAKFGIVSSQG